MQIELPLITLAVWFFLTKKLPTWGWFARIEARFTGPVAWVWDGWKACAYCGGFWLAMLLRALTGRQTLPALDPLPLPIDWIADAFATAILALFGFLVIETLAYPIRTRAEAAKAKAEAETDAPGARSPEP
jgi:hypothetical protein